jgi:hypothetical protein
VRPIFGSREGHTLQDIAALVNLDTIWLASGKSGGGPPQSKTLPRRTVTRVNAKRLGLLQPSDALTKCAYVNMNCYTIPHHCQMMWKMAFFKGAGMALKKPHNGYLRVYASGQAIDNELRCSFVRQQQRSGCARQFPPRDLCSLDRQRVIG